MNILINKYTYIALLVAAGLGCTANMSDRIREQMTVESGSFHRLKAKNIVRDSLQFPSDEFSLSLQSGDPLRTPNGAFPFRLLKAEFIPFGERMIFAIIDPVKGEIKPEFEFEVLESGQVRVFGKSGMYLADEIPFLAADGLLASKPIEYAIVSKKKRTSAIASFIPLPLSKSLGAKTLSLSVNHPMLTRFKLNGEGFQPHETVQLRHTFGAKQEVFELLADENGAISTELKPFVIGTLGGEAQIAAGDLILDYPWGTRLEKMTHEQKAIFPVLFVINPQDSAIDDLKIQKAFASYSLNLL